MNDFDELHCEMQRLTQKIDEILKLLNGNGSLGLVSMVLILWRSYIWVAGLCGVVVGAGVMKLFGM